MIVKKAMLLAAGLGTRLKPWTDHHPKALAIVNGKSLLQRNIEYLQGYGIYDVVINVHHFAEQIIEALQINSGWGSHYTISNESHAILETGGGLLHCKQYLQHAGHFVLMNADILTNLNLNKLRSQHLQNKNALATLAIMQRDSSRQLLFTQTNILGGWRNNSSEQEKILRPQSILCPFAFSGIHIINSTIFQHITLEGKFSMIDLYLSLCAQHSIYGYNHTGDILMDLGKPESLALAATVFE